jgi:hypothetical protein
MLSLRIPTLGFALTASLAFPSIADDNLAALTRLCTAAISRPSNSVTSLERQQWARSAADSICQTGFNTASSLKTAAGGLNLSIPVAGTLFGLGASGDWSDMEIQQAYQKIGNYTFNEPTSIFSMRVTSRRIDNKISHWRGW